MDEYGAAPPSDAWPRIMIELDDHVIEMIGAPKAIARCVGLRANRLIVSAVVRLFAPGINETYPPRGQQRAGVRAAIRAPPQPHQAKLAAGRGAVAFALVGADAGAAYGGGQLP
jgi:hypothetical protein